MRRLAPLFLLALAVPGVAQDMPLSQILLPESGWQPVDVGQGRKVSSLAGDPKGNLYLAGPESAKVLSLGVGGTPGPVTETSASGVGLTVSADGAIFTAQPEGKRIVRHHNGEERVVVEGLAAHDLVVTGKGSIYCTVPDEGAVYLIDPSGEKKRVAEGISRPTGITLWADEGTLVVAESEGRHLWAYRVEADGTLSAGERYYPLRVRPRRVSGAGGLTVDADGRLYAASREGVQVFDPTGRLSGVLPMPGNRRALDVGFAGPDGDLIYAACGDAVYVRKLKVKGAR